jgi:starch phosphorylase
MNRLTLAYFSMEFGIDPAIPTYAGGLGVLAGDTMRAAADLGLPAAGVTLLHRKGYFHQQLDDYGNQLESSVVWSPEEFLELLPLRIQIVIAGQRVHVQAWRYRVRSELGHTVPVYFLDTAIPENDPWFQSLTDSLYGGDDYYRLCQEVVLGFGGIAMLRALGYLSVQAYHMNEGHSTLVTLALLEEQIWGRSFHEITPTDIEAVRQHCVFTTHTPLPVGHDEFSIDLAREVIGDNIIDFLVNTGYCSNGLLNMTNLALCFSAYVNGVSMRHEETSRTIFPNHRIDSVTNGVHAVTWTSPPFRRVYDRYIPQWRRDNLYLKHAIRIPLEEIWQAHTEAKQQLLSEIEKRTQIHLDSSVMTIGLARRVVAYKRPDLLFYDLERLRHIAVNTGPLQIIYGGKAHPQDESGKALIRRIFEVASALGGTIPVIYLQEYDMELAKYICDGVDLWLNTPQRPNEASGTSGMKAALNGVPSFSVLDGWWIEGHIEGVTGWSIGDSWQSDTSLVSEAASLYDKLEHIILPMFYQQRNNFISIMRSVIAQNGSYFNAQRMLTQYLQNAYRLTENR